MALLRDLGADEVIDYQTVDIDEVLSDFDVVIDTLGNDQEAPLLATLKTGAGARYVSLVSPMMLLTDEHGYDEGMRRYEEVRAAKKAEQAALGREFDWSFMHPDGDALATVAGLLADGRIRAVIDREYPMEELAAAHEYVESRRARGKVMVRIRPE